MTTWLEELTGLMSKLDKHRAAGYVWHFCLQRDEIRAVNKPLRKRGVSFRLILSERQNWLMVKETDVDIAQTVIGTHIKRAVQIT